MEDKSDEPDDASTSEESPDEAMSEHTADVGPVFRGKVGWREITIL